MSTRDEALCAVLNAARGVRQSGMQDVRLDALYSALAAYEAVDGAPAPPMRPPGLCAELECWAYRWQGRRYCFEHRDRETLTGATMRDPVFTGGEDGG